MVRLIKLQSCWRLSWWRGRTSTTWSISWFSIRRMHSYIRKRMKGDIQGALNIALWSPTSHSIFWISKGCRLPFSVQGNCVQILTRLAHNLLHKSSTKCVINCLRNLYVIVYSCLIRAEFLFDDITSVLSSISYIKMLQITFFVQIDRLWILTRLDKNIHHKLSTQFITNCLQNLCILLSKLIWAKFSFDTITSVLQKLRYCNKKETFEFDSSCV